MLVLDFFYLLLIITGFYKAFYKGKMQSQLDAGVRSYCYAISSNCKTEPSRTVTSK